MTTFNCENFREELTRKIYKTKSVRFRAYDRLIRLHKLYTNATAFLSGYLIIISIIGIYLNQENHLFSDNIPYIVVGIALILLIFNLTESKKEYKNNAEKMHNCARELNRLHLKLTHICNSNIIDREEEMIEYREVSKQYATILEKYDGHATKDFNIFRVNSAERKKDDSEEIFKIPWYRVIQYKWDYHYKQFIKYWILLYVPLPIIIYYLWTILN